MAQSCNSQGQEDEATSRLSFKTNMCAEVLSATEVPGSPKELILGVRFLGLDGETLHVSDQSGDLFIQVEKREDQEALRELPKDSVLSLKVMVAPRGEVLLTSFCAEATARNEVLSETEHRFYKVRKSKRIQKNLTFRSQFLLRLRDFLQRNGFLELETPILTSPSPEGGSDFFVMNPRDRGTYYALPQSPQVLKQLLIASGFDRYFQIAPCFRSTDARRDRLYGEFRQLDLEMSFVTPQELMSLAEKLARYLFLQAPEPMPIDSFQRISYRDAIFRYASENPDLRNPVEFEEVPNQIASRVSIDTSSTTLRALRLPLEMRNLILDVVQGHCTDTEVRTLATYHANGVELLILAAPKNRAAEKTLSSLRTKLAGYYGFQKNAPLKACIVHSFPIFEWNSYLQRFIFRHNPFSEPQSDSLENNPEALLGTQFDVVINGWEIASGATRVRNRSVFEKLAPRKNLWVA